MADRDGYDLSGSQFPRGQYVLDTNDKLLQIINQPGKDDFRVLSFSNKSILLVKRTVFNKKLTQEEGIERVRSLFGRIPPDVESKYTVGKKVKTKFDEIGTIDEITLPYFIRVKMDDGTDDTYFNDEITLVENTGAKGGKSKRRRSKRRKNKRTKRVK